MPATNSTSGSATGFGKQPRGPVMAVAGPVLAMVLATLDNLILGTAMPTVVSELGGGDRLTWVVTTYALATAVSTPVWGKLGDMYGRKRVFLASIAIFLVGSLLAGLAQTIDQLVVLRAVQGLGAGGLMVGAFAIIMDVVPPRRGGAYQGAVASIMGVAMIAGPPIGGVITDQLGWRWVFFVNLPLGALALLFVGTTLDLPRRRSSGRVDYAGAGLLGCALSCLVLALSWGGGQHAWTSAVILGLLGLAVSAAAAFVAVERRAAQPLLPLQLFSNRTFSINTAMGLFLGAGMLVAMVFVPVFVQAVQGASATRSGLQLAPLLGGDDGLQRHLGPRHQPDRPVPDDDDRRQRPRRYRRRAAVPPRRG